MRRPVSREDAKTRRGQAAKGAAGTPSAQASRRSGSIAHCGHDPNPQSPSALRGTLRTLRLCGNPDPETGLTRRREVGNGEGGCGDADPRKLTVASGRTCTGSRPAGRPFAPPSGDIGLTCSPSARGRWSAGRLPISESTGVVAFSNLPSESAGAATAAPRIPHAESPGSGAWERNGGTDSVSLLDREEPAMNRPRRPGAGLSDLFDRRELCE